MGMEKIIRVFRRLAFVCRFRNGATDLAAELEDHRARIQVSLEADGIPADEAAALSRRAMGNITLAREDARDVWISALAQRLWRDAIYGARTLRREPTFAVTAMLTLVLGIATATTVFSVADAELWRPLPFPSPKQLFAVNAYRSGTGGDSERVPAPDFLDWQRESRLAEFAAQESYGRRVLRRGSAQSVIVQSVTANYFEVLRHTPRIGRAFVPGQDDRDHSAILSDRGWRQFFDADPAVLGAVLRLDNVNYTVVGINAGQHLEFGSTPDVYVTFDPSGDAFRDRAARLLAVIGRHRDGVTLGQAQSELQSINARIAQAFPADHTGHRVVLQDLRRAYSSYNWRPLFFFLTAAGLVLVLSCLNVANLLLARALRRQREFSIRGALGGGRATLIRQLVVEGAVLAVPSAAAGLLLSAWALRIFASEIPEDYLVRGGHFPLNARITLFVAGVSALTTVLLSLAPMFFARRVDLNMMLGQGNRAVGRSPRQIRMRNALLIGQLTVTLVLTTAAALFTTSFARLLQVPLGFEPRDRLALRVTLSGSSYAGDEAVRAFTARLLERARATAGVADAAVDSTSPLDSGPLMRLVDADRPRPAPGGETRTIVRAVTPDAFRVLGIPVRSGRSFADADGSGAPRVAVINEYLATKLFPGENALGKRLELVPGSWVTWARRPGIVEVVGVVANVKDVGLNEVEFGNLYLPFAQAPAPGLELVVRTSVPAAQLAPALRAAVAEVDSSLPVTRVQTLEARVDAALKGDRFNLLLIAGFAVVAILIAGVGIYGAMACAVQERTREFGVRLALGQQPDALLRATLWQSTRFGIYGGVLGLAAVLIIARLLGNALYLVRGEHNGLLYGVTTTEPFALISAAAGLIAIATVSGLLPARQVTRVDPVIALRNE